MPDNPASNQTTGGYIPPGRILCWLPPEQYQRLGWPHPVWQIVWLLVGLVVGVLLGRFA